MCVSHAPVAQLDRVSGYEPEGRGFESLPAYQKYRGNFCYFGIFILLIFGFTAWFIRVYRNDWLLTNILYLIQFDKANLF